MPATDPLLSIQLLHCPTEEGEGRYESTYLLGFVQLCSVWTRAGVAHQLTRIFAVVGICSLVTAQGQQYSSGKSYSRYMHNDIFQKPQENLREFKIWVQPKTMVLYKKVHFPALFWDMENMKEGCWL